MKKAISLLMLIFLFSCQATDRTIYLFIYNMEDPYIEVLGEEIVRLASENHRIELVDAQNSQIIQNETIEEALKEKPSLLIINPVDRLGAYPIIDKAKAADVPVIFINREPLERDLKRFDRAFYVGALAEQSGMLQAELVAELFGNDPSSLNHHDKNEDNIIQAIIFKGEQGHQDAELRTTHVVRELEERGFELDILTTEIANWNTEVAYEATRTLFESDQDQVEVILSNNDAMALGIIDALIEYGYFSAMNDDGTVDQNHESWMPILGIDGIDQAVERMRSGHLYATVLNDALGQAEATVELAEAILSGEDLDALDQIVDDRYVWVDYKKFVLSTE
jgi:methyl-galactoside transport system substrate-binding protein